MLITGTPPGCWGPMITPAFQGGHEVTQPVAIAGPRSAAAPVLVDGDTWVSDSWVIAEYLEAAYPDRPSIFGSRQTQGVARFIDRWTDAVLVPAAARVVLTDMPDLLGEADRDYWRWYSGTDRSV